MRLDPPLEPGEVVRSLLRCPGCRVLDRWVATVVEHERADGTVTVRLTTPKLDHGPRTPFGPSEPCKNTESVVLVRTDAGWTTRVSAIDLLAELS